MRIAVLIPALNEAGNVARLIGEIPRDAAESNANRPYRQWLNGRYG